MAWCQVTDRFPPWWYYTLGTNLSKLAIGYYLKPWFGNDHLSWRAQEGDASSSPIHGPALLSIQWHSRGTPSWLWNKRGFFWSMIVTLYELDIICIWWVGSQLVGSSPGFAEWHITAPHSRLQVASGPPTWNRGCMETPLRRALPRPRMKYDSWPLNELWQYLVGSELILQIAPQVFKPSDSPPKLVLRLLQDGSPLPRLLVVGI